jgi:O-methyltransferase
MKLAGLLPEPLKQRLYPAYSATVTTIDLSSPIHFRRSLRDLRLFSLVWPYTMTTFPRLKSLLRLTRQIDALGVVGVIVECGVANGGTAAVMAYGSRRSRLQRDVWLFDSFEGLPPPTPEDGRQALDEYHPGWCLGDIAKVKEILSRLSIQESRVHVVKGWFHDTLPEAKIPSIALLHIDADWYDSVKLCLERFYDLVSPGGFIVLDDYGYWEGCQKATDEFLLARGLSVELIGVQDNPNSPARHQYYFQKPKSGGLVK